MGLRVFFVDDNDALIKVTFASWDRLCNDHPKECFPEHARKRLRYIFVILELVKRKPVFISHIDCSYVTFDAAGKVDREEWDKQLHLAVESAALLEPERTHANVVMVEDRFAKRTYQHRYSWDFPDGMLDCLIKAVFG